jgi:alpha-ribazole phosphatase
MHDAQAGHAWVWRHPRPEGAQGRCIGARTDLPVHWRRAKRLARRIQALARRERRPHVVRTSPLARCADVGRWLRRWGWRHLLDTDLRELDFGTWDGRPWDEIGRPAIDAWVASFASFAPPGGESLGSLIARARGCHIPPGALVVGHGGWMLARRWLVTCEGDESAEPLAAAWARPPRHGECWRLAGAQRATGPLS